MLNSLLFDLDDKTEPLMIESESATTAVLMIFRELELYYGPELEIEIGVSVAE